MFLETAALCAVSVELRFVSPFTMYVLLKSSTRKFPASSGSIISPSSSVLRNIPWFKFSLKIIARLRCVVDEGLSFRILPSNFTFMSAIVNNSESTTFGAAFNAFIYLFCERTRKHHKIKCWREIVNYVVVLAGI